MAKIVSIHSFRGGTGKSNVTANTAAQFATMGHRVGVIDTDIQSPGIHVLFGMDEEQIDKIIMEFEEQVGSYMDVVHAGEAGFEGSTSIAERENKEPAALEKELLQEKKPEKEEAELAVIEPVKEEEPVETHASASEPAQEEEEEEDEVVYE